MLIYLEPITLNFKLSATNIGRNKNMNMKNNNFKNFILEIFMSLLVNFAHINTKSSQSGYSYNHHNNKSIQLIFYKRNKLLSIIRERFAYKRL